jgi:hypothetical protein
LHILSKNVAHRREGKTTAALERGTSTIPSIVWLIAAGASIVGSAALMLSGRRNDANFVGQWAPTFLLLGVYNKLVKIGREL